MDDTKDWDTCLYPKCNNKVHPIDNIMGYCDPYCIEMHLDGPCGFCNNPPSYCDCEKD